MSDETFAELDTLQQTSGGAATIDKLTETLLQAKDYHRLFDALLLKKKFELDLPLTRPTSLDDVPSDKREEFEDFYVSQARRVGQLLLDNGQIGEAWVYFRTIREPEPVAKALDAIDPKRAFDDRTEELINVAVYEGANPAKGLELMLHSHGTCNTVTATDQMMPQMMPADRKLAAALLARHLYGELCQSIKYDVERRMSLTPPGDSLRELFTGRDWLFEEGNYHIDVSHLNATVRFARALDVDNPELKQAMELAEYGSQLDPQLQYAGDPPFEDFYRAHVQYFKVLADEDRDAALEYFREKLAAASDPQDKQLVAYVLVDLLVRVKRLDDAVDVAEEHLSNLDDSSGFSFAELCQRAGRMDRLRSFAQSKSDLVAYTAALVQEASASQQATEVQ